MTFETRTIKIAVVPKNEPIFSRETTTIEIVDDSGGEYLEVCQCNEENEGKICINPEEWPTIKEAIEKMLEECRL